MEKWITKTWDFRRSSLDLEQNLEKLKESPQRIAGIIAGCDPAVLTTRHDEKWSANEHIGHLLTIESLWIARLDDFVMGNPTLRPWNGHNRDTEDGQFNRQRSAKILEDFEDIRMAHVKMIAGLGSEKMLTSAFHERLNRNLSLSDHIQMMAEHDEHHLQLMISILTRS